MHTLFGITLVLYLQDYILQYFATKLHNFTKFKKLFPTVLKLFSNLKLCLIGNGPLSFSDQASKCFFVFCLTAQLSNISLKCRPSPL